MNVNKRIKWTMAWRKEKVTSIVKDSDKWHDTVKANEFIMLLGNLEKPEYTELRGTA